MTGLVIVMVMTQVGARVCRDCGVRACLHGAVLSLALGWWGLFRFFVTPGFVLHDLVMILRVLLTRLAGSYAREVLEEEREHARRLLATKDLETVVEVLVARTELDEDEVRKFLASLSA